MQEGLTLKSEFSNLIAIIEYLPLCSMHYNTDRREKIAGEMRQVLYLNCIVALTVFSIISTLNSHWLSKYRYGFLLGLNQNTVRRIYLKLPREPSAFFKSTLMGGRTREGQIAFKLPPQENTQASPCLQVRAPGS